MSTGGKAILNALSGSFILNADPFNEVPGHLLFHEKLGLLVFSDRRLAPLPCLNGLPVQFIQVLK